MYCLKKIKHSLVDKKNLDEIVKIKSVAWNHPYKEQIKWINSNLKDSDMHVLLFDNNHAIAYLNLISIILNIENVEYEAFGIGNVCVFEKGKGLGHEIMVRVATLFEEENKIGFLFCKEGLVDFYSKSGWSLVDKLKLLLSFDNKNIETMLFNYAAKYENISYTGMSF